MFCLDADSSKNKMITNPGFATLLGINDREKGAAARARIADTRTSNSVTPEDKAIKLVVAFPSKNVSDMLAIKINEHGALLSSFTKSHMSFKHL